MKCKLSLLITSFALVCVLLISAPLTANAAVGVGSLWDGSFDVVFPESFLYMDFSRAYRYNLTDSQAVPQYTYTLYNSSDNVRIEIESRSTDVYLNGSFRARVNIAPATPKEEYSFLTVSSEPVVLPGVYITTELIERSRGGSTTYDIYVEFDNYYVDQSSISLPIKITHSLAGVWTTTSDNPSTIVRSNITVVSDYAGDIMQYDNLEDVPSLDGYFAEQNQTIINQSQTQNNLTTQQNTLIQNQTNQDIQNSQNEINQSIANSQNEINQGIANTDKLANGYDDSEMNNTSGMLGDSIGDLEDAEDIVVNFGKDNLDAYTITTGGILAVSDKLNSGMSLVSSMLQSIYTSAESWSYVIALGFTLTISSMVTGLFRYFKE